MNITRIIKMHFSYYEKKLLRKLIYGFSEIPKVCSRKKVIFCGTKIRQTVKIISSEILGCHNQPQNFFSQDTKVVQLQK